MLYYTVPYHNMPYCNIPYYTILYWGSFDLLWIHGRIGRSLPGLRGRGSSWSLGPTFKESYREPDMRGPMNKDSPRTRSACLRLGEALQLPKLGGRLPRVPLKAPLMRPLAFSARASMARRSRNCVGLGALTVVRTRMIAGTMVPDGNYSYGIRHFKCTSR